MNGDLVNAGSVFEGQDDVHVPGQTEHGVDAIEMGLSFMHDEELTATRVLSSVRHRQGTRDVLFAVDFTVDHVAGAAGSGHATGSFAAVGASPLGHETVDHTVKGKSVIKTILCQLDEVGHGVGSVLIEHLQCDVAGVRGHENGRQGVNSKTPC